MAYANALKDELPKEKKKKGLSFNPWKDPCFGILRCKNDDNQSLNVKEYDVDTLLDEPISQEG